jgi:WD40 repeat protein
VLAPKAVKSARFSPDGKLLATADYRGVDLWRPASGRHVAVLDDGTPTKLMNDAEFSPDGRLLAAAGQDGAVRIWDVARRTRLFYFVGHTNPVLAVSWSPDGRFVVDGSADGTAYVWQVTGTEQGQRVALLAGHGRPVTSVAFGSDGASIRTESADGTARIWDTRFEQNLEPLGSHPGGAITASFGADGRLAVSAGADGTVRIWDVRRRRLLHELSAGGVADARLSPDGRLAAWSWYTDSQIGATLWVRAERRLRTLPGAEAGTVVRFSPDGKTVVTGGSKGVVQLWRTRDGSLIWTKKQAGAVTDAVFAPDGKTVVTAGSRGARVWPTRDGRAETLKSLRAVSRVAFSPDGSLIAAAGSDGRARIWDAASGRLLHALGSSPLPLTDVAFSPDGRLLLTTRMGIKDNVQLWDVASGKLRREMVGAFGSVPAGDFSPDGRWIVTAGPISAALWQTGSGHPYFFLRGGDTKLQSLTGVSFSPDGQLVLSASKDGSVRLYRCEVCGNLNRLLALAEHRLAAR